MTTKSVAFLGLGAIGAPMARQVVKGFPATVVWNRTSRKTSDFVARYGGTMAELPADAVKDADIIVTCFATSEDLYDVLFGGEDAEERSGVASSLKSGSLLVDCTSGNPATSRTIASRLAKEGVRFIDAPVSGGVAGAEAGELTIMCGGEKEDIEAARPVLETFGARIVHCGAVGTGDALKAVNNALLALHVWSTAEGLTLLKRAGVDATVALDVINSSSGRSNASVNLFPERVLDRSFPQTFRLALLDKDARIAADLADQMNIPAETLKLASRLYGEARASLGETADHVEAVKEVETRAGIKIS